jgi:hypothetical protein
MKNHKYSRVPLCSALVLSWGVAIAPPIRANETCLIQTGPKRFAQVTESCQPQVKPDANKTEAPQVIPQGPKQAGHLESRPEAIGGAEVVSDLKEQPIFPQVMLRGPRRSLHIVH